MKNYIKLLRVKHYLKNLLLFLPLIFSKNLFDSTLFFITFLGFLAFSCLASVIYINNDIHDIQSDRKHEIKKYRPLAAGKITIKNAKILEIILLILTCVLLSYLYTIKQNIFIFILPILYLILNILYSKGLKNIAIIDIIILVSGFLIRVLFGSIIVGVNVSNWLYLMVVFGSFYLGLGKRRNEIKNTKTATRKVLEQYNKEFLDKNMYSCLTLSLVFYSLWCIDPITLARIHNDFLIWTVPIVMIIFMMYSLEIEKNNLGDPVEVIFKNKKLMIMIGVYGIMMFLILYVIQI